MAKEIKEKIRTIKEIRTRIEAYRFLLDEVIYNAESWVRKRIEILIEQLKWVLKEK